MGLLLITHDLAVVSGMAHRVALMYAGQIIEVATRPTSSPRPSIRTRGCCCTRCPTRPGAAARWRRSPARCRRLRSTSTGCRFAPRCDRVMPPARRRRRRCSPLGATRSVRCLLYRARAQRRPTCRPMPDRATFAPAARRPPVCAPPTPPSGRRDGRTAARGAAPQRCASRSAAACCSARTASSAPSTACRSSIARRRRRWRWSASRAAARRPPARRSCSCCAAQALIEGRALLDGQRPVRARRRRAARGAARDPDHLPGPVRVAEPAHARARRSSTKACWRCAPRWTRRRAGAPDRGAGRAGRPAARRARPLSARVLRRPAAAHRDRARAGGAAEADRLRRADLGARRLGAGADPQPAARSCSASSACRYLFITHNIGVVEYLADDVAVMQRGRIVEKGPTTEVLRAPQPRTPARCWPPCRELAAGYKQTRVVCIETNSGLSPVEPLPTPP